MNNFFKKVKKKGGSFQKTKTINPHGHWALLVKFFLFLGLALILLGLWLLYRIRNEQIFQAIPPSSNPPSLVKEKLLEEVTQSFKNKEIKRSEAENGNLFFGDPS